MKDRGKRTIDDYPLYIEPNRSPKPFPYCLCWLVMSCIVLALWYAEYNGIINIAKYLK